MAVEKTAKGKKDAKLMKDEQNEVEEKNSSSMDVQKISKSGSSSWILTLFSVVAIIAAIGFGVSKIPTHHLPVSVRSLLNLKESSLALSLFHSVGNKYESDIVIMNTRKLLRPDPTCKSPSILGDLVHVEAALDKSEQLKKENKVFMLLNGQNDGLFLEWDKDSDCLHKLAETAAVALGADPDFFPNGLRLYNGMGIPITTSEELDSDRIAYILVDFQIWVWPGIRVGYTRIVDNVTMTTISLSPLVFDTYGFFSLDEANAIIEHGSANLVRSPVDSPDAVDGYHSDRTSHTAFLDDTQFTRNFRKRTASLARLPSPSFVERMQLVRYEAGQFFRKHEDYFSSKSFLGKTDEGMVDFKKWSTWAATAIDNLEDKSTLPIDYLPGGKLYPQPEDTVTWQISVLEIFLEDKAETTFFADHADVAWRDWIKENVENGAHGIMETLMGEKSYMLTDIIASWEARTNIPSLHYSKPKAPPSGVSQYFRWLRWAKERVQELGDKAPVHVRPAGNEYPSYRLSFQNKLVAYVLNDYTEDQLLSLLGKEWADWLRDNKDAADIVIDGAKTNPKIFELVVEAWTKRAGPGLFDYVPPVHMKHFEPNRFVTLFLYLNDVDEGGETVFPHSKERLVTNIQRVGMDECSEGLAVPPIKLHASLFYAQTPQNELDPLSLHGGCPPAKGVKFGANSFTWNADADEGSVAWGF